MRTSALLIPLLAQALGAQESIPAENIPTKGDLYEIRWSVGDDGNTWMTPAPRKGLDDGSERLFGDVDSRDSFAMEFLQNGGALGFAMLVCPGPTDLLALTDVQQHFRYLGYATDDVSLSQRIATKPDGQNAALVRRAYLERMLAMRLAARTQRAQVVPLLERIAGDASEDRFVRRTAAEAHAELTGGPAPAWEQSLQPIAEVMAAMPKGVEQLGVVLFDAMPPSHALAPISKEAGLTVTRREILRAGGTCSPAQLAGAMRLSMVPGAAPFEAMRVCGMQNPRRLVSGFCETGPDRGLFIAEGMFSPEPLIDVLEMLDDSIEPTFEGGVLRAELPGDATLTITETRIELRIGAFEPAGSGLVEALASQMPTEDDSYWGWLRDVRTLPLDQIPVDLPIFEHLQGPVVMRAISGNTLVSLEVQYDSEKAAKVAANGLRQLPGLFAPAMVAESDIPQDLVNELVRGFSAENDGVTVSMKLEHDLVFPELVGEWARAIIDTGR